MNTVETTAKDEASGVKEEVTDDSFKELEPTEGEEEEVEEEEEIPYDMDVSVQSFILNAQNKVISADESILEVVKVFRDMVLNIEWTLAKDLLEIAQDQFLLIKKNLTLDNSVNVARRILKLICQAYFTCIEEAREYDSFEKYITNENLTLNYTNFMPELKDTILKRFDDLQKEIEGSTASIIKYASENIKTNDVIMTYGYSKLVEEFLKGAAATNATFEVVVVFDPCTNVGKELALNLSESLINVTLISLSAINIVMSRISKVIIEPQTVLGDGGLRAISGMDLIGLSSKHYRVPFIVLSPMYRIDVYCYKDFEVDTFSSSTNPGDLIDCAEGDFESKVDIRSTEYCYLSPNFITVIISNTGPLPPPLLSLSKKLFYYPPMIES